MRLFFFFLSEWFLVPVVGFMKDLVHGQKAKPPGQSWQPPEGLLLAPCQQQDETLACLPGSGLTNSTWSGHMSGRLQETGSAP